ncbi:MAG: hypothetical protein VXX27_04930, partial [Pseudomonadota bacterium]|nr:hypothetical protein [Pseudomonadota bacterium]
MIPSVSSAGRAGNGLGLSLSIATRLALGACGGHDRLADYRPVVDSYRTDMAAYDADLRQCVSIAQRAEAEYERKSREQRDARAVTGLLVGAVIGSTDGNAGDGAVIGGSFGLLEGTLADSEYDPHKSPRMIVDRCMKT